MSWIREFMWVNVASLAKMIDRKYEALVLLYPDSGISMYEESVLGGMIWSYNKAEL